MLSSLPSFAFVEFPGIPSKRGTDFRLLVSGFWFLVFVLSGFSSTFSRKKSGFSHGRFFFPQIVCLIRYADEFRIRRRPLLAGVL
jgi:hypothetical protein